MHVTINYLAVVVAAAAAFVLGLLWWSPPLFGKLWWPAHGYTDEQMAEGRKRAPRNLTVFALGLLLAAWAIAVLAGYTHLKTAVQGLKLGALAWLGFAFSLGLIDAAMHSSRRKTAAFFIDSGFWLLALLVTGVIIAVWH